MKNKIIEARDIIKGWITQRRLFILTIIVFVFLIATPVTEKLSVLPDFLNLSNVSSKDYFGLIIGAIASIFGILMAVILLTVEVFKEKLNKNEHTNPLENKLIRNSIYNSVNLIGLSFIAYAFFDDFHTSKSLTIGYFLGGIFIVYIYSVYPVLRRIIGKSSHIKNNIDLISTLDLNSFKTASRYRLHKPEDGNEILKTLKKELDLYILNNNVSAYEKINNDIVIKALNLVSDGQDRNNCDTIVNGLVWLWRENCKVAIRVGDSYYFELIWKYIQDIYVYFANEKAPLLHLQDLHFFIIFDFLKFHIKLDNALPFSVALDCIEVSFKANLLNNCPKQADIADLVEMYEGIEFTGMDFHNSNQWDNIKEILDYIPRIQETAIELNDKDSFEECNRRIVSICTELNFHMPSLGYYQKGNITWHSLTTSFLNSNKALESGMYESTKDCLDVPHFFLIRFIDDDNVNKKDIRIIIRTLADYIILAFKDGKLFTNGHFGTLKQFSLIGISCLKNYNSKKVEKQSVDYIIKVLKHLKNIAEKDLSSINPNDYSDIKKRIKHFIDTAVNRYDFDENKKPVKKWVKIYNDFDDVSEEIDFGIVKWKVE